MKQFLRAYFPMLQILILPNLAFSQISGSVFKDANSDKQYKTDSYRKGFSNVQIKAYERTETGKQELIAQTQTDIKGNYFLNIPEGRAVRYDGNGIF